MNPTVSRPPAVAGIVLAAGRSRRLGRLKPLVPLAGRPLVTHALAAALASRLQSVVLVLGNRQAAVRGGLGGLARHRKLRIVVNRRYRQGQSTSLQAGLQAVMGTGTGRAVMFLLADQPFVTPTLVNRLLAAGVARQKPVCAPTCRGTRGTPVLVHHSLFGRLLRLSGDTGARGLIRAHPQWVRRVEIASPRPFFDIDTRGDWQRAKAALARR